MFKYKNKKISQITEETLEEIKTTDIVKFEDCFNQCIDILESYTNITQLEFGGLFNMQILHFPPNLKYLDFCGTVFDQPLDNLPTGLEHLAIYSKFNQRLDNLPSTLKYLYLLGHNFNQSLDFLPIGLFHLQLGNCCHNIQLDNLPNTIIDFRFAGTPSVSLDMLPDSIENLDIKDYKEKINKLPKNLKRFKIHSTYQYLRNIRESCPDIKIETYFGYY